MASLKIGLGHGATTDSLDPATYPDQMTGTFGWGSIGNSLTEVDVKGQIQPDLAESFESVDNATKWVFKLRKGLTFHNGKSVTAADVVASFKHHMGKDLKSAAKSVLAAVSDVKADGDNVVFTLSGANGDFSYLTSDYHIPICPANADGTMDWQSGVRTGPYIMDKWEPGVRATAKKNPNYHRTTFFDDMTMTVIADVAARTNALTSGEVDFIDRCDLKTVDLLKQNPDIEVDAVTGFGHYVFVMNTQQAPFDKPEVRSGPQVRNRPRGDRQEGVPRLRIDRQRQPDRAVDCFRHQPGTGPRVQSGQGQGIAEGRGCREPHRRSVGRRCRLRRRRRCRPDLRRERQLPPASRSTSSRKPTTATGTSSG